MVMQDATESTARVELHSKCQTVSVDRTRIAVVGGSAKAGALSTYNQTPASYTEGYDTPAYSAGRTPQYGAQTPQYDGSRTPHYGGATPSHDGSRTPGQSGAWDPTITNTPARSNDYEDYDYDQNPSPAYSPATPGSAFHGTDTAQGPYTPHTPGTSYGSDHTYSPYQPSPSPAGYQASPSPAGYAPTPSPGQVAFHPSPGMASSYTSPSPMSYSPMTPGVAPSPLNPQTPGAGMDSFNFADWFTTDIEVRVKDSHNDAGLGGQEGVIRGISGGMCSVFLPMEDRVVTVAGEWLEPVVPVRRDRVKIILGEDRESTGLLMSIDHQDGVVKLDSGDVRMFQLRFLCKMTSKPR